MINVRKREKVYQYQYYHLEEVKNKDGKVTEYRLVEPKRNNKKLKSIDLIFTKKNGVYNGTDVIRYPYKIIHYELNIKNCRFYDLRGSYATNSLRNGVEIKDVAETLGHSKIETTENYYISSSETTKRLASRIFEETIQSEYIDKIICYKFKSD